MVEYGPNLMELIVSRVEVPHRSEIVIFLGGYRPFVIQVVRDSRAWDKFQVPKTPSPVRIHNRIEDNVYGMKMNSDNRPDLGGNAPRFPEIGIDAELEIDPVEQRVRLRMGPDE